MCVVRWSSMWKERSIWNVGLSFPFCAEFSEVGLRFQGVVCQGSLPCRANPRSPDLRCCRTERESFPSFSCAIVRFTESLCTRCVVVEFRHATKFSNQIF